MSNLSDLALGPTVVDITMTAGESLLARDVVYVAIGGGLTTGRAYKCNGSSSRMSTSSFYIGLVVSNISAGATGTVRIMGAMTGFTVTAGAPQYASAATAGALTETYVSGSLLVGMALDSGTVLINSFGDNTAITTA